MTFSISEFTSEVNRRGLAQNNLFYVVITLPNSLLTLEDQIGSRELSFLCRSVDVPGMDIGTTVIKNQGFGIGEKRPVDFQFENLQTVFMMDGEFATMKFFHRWMQEIVNYDTSSGQLAEVKGRVPFEFGYKEDYAATVTVHMYSSNHADHVYTWQFGKAWPVQVGNVQNAWENTADVMTLPVSFTFSELKVDGAVAGVVSEDNSRGNGLLTYLSAANSWAQAINQISRPQNIQDLINEVSNISTITNAL